MKPISFEAMSLEEIIVHIKIEEHNRLRDIARNLQSKANVIETKPQLQQRQNNPNKKYPNKGKIPLFKRNVTIMFMEKLVTLWLPMQK